MQREVEQLGVRPSSQVAAALYTRLRVQMAINKTGSIKGWGTNRDTGSGHLKESGRCSRERIRPSHHGPQTHSHRGWYF